MRARVFSTEAIPIRRMDFGEADRIITALTPRDGKLRLLAKGVRRPTSRMAGHLEPFTHTRIRVARGRDLDLVTEASTIEPFRAVREDLTRAVHAFHWAELVDGFLPDGEAQADVFGLLRSALVALENRDDVAELVSRHFELHLLSVLGYRPELTACVSCRAEIRPVPNGYSASMGGVLCANCAPAHPGTTSVSVDALKLFRFLQRTPFGIDLSLKAPRGVLQEGEELLRRHLEWVLERRLRAADFIRQFAQVQRQ